MSNNETYTIIKLKDDGLVKNRVKHNQDSEDSNLSFYRPEIKTIFVLIDSIINI